MFVELISYDVTQFFWPIVPSAYSAALIILPEIENISFSTNVATCLSGSPKMNADVIFYSTFLLRLSYLTTLVSLSPLLSSVGSNPAGWEENSEVLHLLRLRILPPLPQTSISVPGQSSGISLSWVGVSALPTPDPPWEPRSGLSSHLCTMVWYEGPTISSNRTFPDSQEICQILNKQHTPPQIPQGKDEISTRSGTLILCDILTPHPTKLF